jgi:hypothetical protein
MFRIPTQISFLGSLILGFSWIFYLCYFKGESLSEIKRNRLQQSLEHFAVAAATQNRTHVQKDIWITEQNLQRLQNRIDSQKSVLVLQPRINSIEITEQLYDVKCWSQEKILDTPQTPMYQLRVLQAKEGLYKYQTQTFEATDATLALYKIPGSSLITNLVHHKSFLQGTAKEISFTVKEGSPRFQAHQFQASLSSGRKL